MLCEKSVILLIRLLIVLIKLWTIKAQYLIIFTTAFLIKGINTFHENT